MTNYTIGDVFESKYFGDEVRGVLAEIQGEHGLFITELFENWVLNLNNPTLILIAKKA